MESLTTNSTPSPLDQAYKRYQNDLRARVTGVESEPDFIKGIVEGTIPREKVRELKSEMVSVEEFKTFYPKEFLVGKEIKDYYEFADKLYEHPVEISQVQALDDGNIVFSDKGDNIFKLIKRPGGGYISELVHQCDSHIFGFQALSDGRFLYLGGDYSGDVKDLYELVANKDALPLVVDGNVKNNYKEVSLVPDFVGEIVSFQCIMGNKVYVATKKGNIRALTFGDDGSYSNKLIIDGSGSPLVGLSAEISDMLVLPGEKIIFRCGWNDRVILANIKGDTLVDQKFFCFKKRPQTFFNNGVLLSDEYLTAVDYDKLESDHDDGDYRSVWLEREVHLGSVDIMPDKNIVVAHKNLVLVLN
jgi:hypothetical protein